jgi:tetratricopeptide (TPR) repeat protein
MQDHFKTGLPMSRHLRRFVRALWVVLTAAVVAPGAFAQSASLPLRAEARVAAGDTSPDARQRAAIEAHRLLWRDAATRLQARSEIKAAQLSAAQVRAYAAALIEVTEQKSTTAASASAPASRVAVTGTMNAAELATRMLKLRKDQDATFDLLAAWADLQQLQDWKAFKVRLLTAKATAAMARTEPATIGGRAPLPDARKRARALVDEALALSPGAPYAQLALGDLFIDEQKAVEAEAEYRKALGGLPDSSEAHRRLAEALRLQGDLDEAAIELAAAIELDPRSARAHTDLALVHRGSGRNKEAIAEYRTAIALDPDLIDARNNLAITLAGERQLEAAVAEFREMTRIDPDSASGYYNMATVLADLDLDVESAAALREVIRINPNHYNAHYNIGELFRLDNKYDDAAKAFKEFLRLAPGDTAAGRRNIERAKRLIEQFENENATPPDTPRNTAPGSMSRPGQGR